MADRARKFSQTCVQSADAEADDVTAPGIDVGLSSTEILDQVRLRYLWLTRSADPGLSLGRRLEYVTRHIPAYADFQGAASIDEFPCMSRDELAANMPQYLSDEVAPADLGADCNFFDHGVAVPRDTVGVYSSTLGNVERIFRTYRSALDAPAVGTHLLTWVENGAGNSLDACTHVHLNFGLVSRVRLSANGAANEKVVRRLLKPYPLVVAGSARSLMHLENVCRELPHGLPTQLVLCADGLLSSDEIELLQNSFGAPVVHAYAIPEAGLIALECLESGNLHVTPETNHVEVAVRNEGVVLEGPGELIVTNLDNQSVGLVRYRTGDIAELRHSECSCGYYGPTIHEWRHASFRVRPIQMAND